MKILRRLAFAGLLLLASVASADVAGTYQVTQETPMGAMDSVVTINADGTGVVAGMMGESTFSGTRQEPAQEE